MFLQTFPSAHSLLSSSRFPFTATTKFCCTIRYCTYLYVCWRNRRKPFEEVREKCHFIFFLRDDVRSGIWPNFYLCRTIPYAIFFNVLYCTISFFTIDVTQSKRMSSVDPIDRKKKEGTRLFRMNEHFKQKCAQMHWYPPLSTMGVYKYYYDSTELTPPPPHSLTSSKRKKNKFISCKNGFRPNFVFLFLLYLYTYQQKEWQK